jgi:hypothetical protein
MRMISEQSLQDWRPFVEQMVNARHKKPATLPEALAELERSMQRFAGEVRKLADISRPE